MDINKIQTLSPSKQKRVFDSLMVKGWKDQDYAKFDRHPRQGAVCALGAAELMLGEKYRYGIEEVFPAAFEDYSMNIGQRIADASNNAGSKEAAIAAVKAISWSKR